MKKVKEASELKRCGLTIRLSAARRRKLDMYMLKRDMTATTVVESLIDKLPEALESVDVQQMLKMFEKLQESVDTLNERLDSLEKLNSLSDTTGVAGDCIEIISSERNDT